jgi:hypothetical protein
VVSNVSILISLDIIFYGPQIQVTYIMFVEATVGERVHGRFYSSQQSTVLIVPYRWKSCASLHVQYTTGQKEILHTDSIYLCISMAKQFPKKGDEVF